MAKTLVEQLVDALTAAVKAELREMGKRTQARRMDGRKHAARSKGRKLDMRCRVKGCRNLSKGPRFGFICDEHRAKLSKKQQQAARESWKAKQAA